MSFVSDYIFSRAHFILWYYTQSSILGSRKKLMNNAVKYCFKSSLKPVMYECAVDACLDVKVYPPITVSFYFNKGETFRPQQYLYKGS